MKAAIIAELGRALARHRRHTLPRRLAHLAYLLHLGYENFDYRADTNGERFVLRALCVANPRQILDVGANVGNWTRAAANLYPHAVVHAFEIVPATFAGLQASTSSLPNVVPNSVGLADSRATVPVRYYPAHTELSGIH